MSRKKKISIIAAIALTAILISMHLLILSLLDPMKDVKAMDRAMTESNQDAFFTHLTLDDKAMLNKQEYLNYLNQADWKNIRTQLTEALNGDKNFDSSIQDFDGNTLFMVKKNTVVPGIYHNYEIQAVPSLVMVHSNLPASFFLKDHSVELKNPEEPLELVASYPGKIEINGLMKTEFGDIKQKQTIEIVPNQSQEIVVEFEFPERTYQITTNVPEATLYINGKSTNKQLKDYEALGPFPEDKEVKMHAEWKDKQGTNHSTEVVNQASGYWGDLDFEFELEEEVMAGSSRESSANSVEAANNHVLSFRDAYEQALNSKDFNIVSSFLAKDAGAELKNYIGKLKDKGYSYNFTNNEVTHSVQNDEDTYKITTNEKFIFTNHLGEQTKYDRNKTYTVEETDEGLKIIKITIEDTNRNEL
ncbi:hypothetical protein MUN89_06460 [Halobacillus salinarum]|uniref:Uncharacterized protein n=1 Tax=Halobacillus salinarum TaxID=2932257 RepID=A0ABY4EMA5_9BACI|nr:hypothetical protein [Halobacillus salinarum]UOQ45580.1 hypothetical protein MUN89_06460 [Halobacillus salinarum]